MVHVTNGGLGPAVLTALKVKTDGNETELNEQLWDAFLKEFEGEISVRLYFLSGTDILQAKEEKELIRIEPKKPRKTLPTALEHKIDKMRFMVTYESLYGETFETISSTHRRTT